MSSAKPYLGTTQCASTVKAPFKDDPNTEHQCSGEKGHLLKDDGGYDHYCGCGHEWNGVKLTKVADV